MRKLHRNLSFGSTDLQSAGFYLKKWRALQELKVKNILAG